MLENFTKWLDQNKPKSARQYTSGYNTINKILIENGLATLDKWNTHTFESNFEKCIVIDEFNKKNSSGNNILTATLSNYKNFVLSMKIENVDPPIIPFENFGWRWATTGISSKLNMPVSLFAVLDALLINGSGEFNKTENFKNIIKKLCENKYEINDRDLIKTLTREENQDESKNIIENSGNYWKHLGLIDPSGQNAKVTDLGKSFLKGIVSKDEFVEELIARYKLPNPVYNLAETELYIQNKINIFPFKIILELFEELDGLKIDKEQNYLSEVDLKKIVIPYSVQYKIGDNKKLVDLIIQFRNDPSAFESWPDCYSHFGDDKGERMVNEYLFFLEAFEFLSSNTGIDTVRSTAKKYYATEKFKKLFNLKEQKSNIVQVTSSDFSISIINDFVKSTENSGLIFLPQLIQRFLASLITKPFVILSGLSGSGKTKLAQAFAKWICQHESQYCIVPVGADWTNREPLVGYPNGLVATEYITPDSGVIHLLLDAIKEENKNKPFFLILDEMNLSHVERYFADFLSIMESDDTIKLYTGNERKSLDGLTIPFKIGWPQNVFIIGTVNIDETTYMFSPKVLDRANVIEFRITDKEINTFLANPNIPKLEKLKGMGVLMAEDFVSIAAQNNIEKNDTITEELVAFFNQLKLVGAEFGYRSATEIMQLVAKLKVLEPTIHDQVCLDIAIMQKLLPKLHGSRSKLVKILIALSALCVEEISSEEFEKNFENHYKKNFEGLKIKYPISFEKIIRMYKNVLANGFTSYAEA